MTDLYTVLWKEITKAVGDRQAFRGSLLQAAIVIVLTGIVVPLTDSTMWTDISTVMMLYVVFPSTLAATIAADAFAGERERRTLESLLASPVSDASIFVGKATAAVALVLSVSMTSLIVGLLIAFAMGRFPQPLVLQLVSGIFAGAVSGGLFVSALASLISIRLAVARSAQQMGSLITFCSAGLVVSILKRFGSGLSWHNILFAESFLTGLGMIALLFGAKTFTRDRVFEQR